MGWCYVTLAVDGEIRPHIETGLNYDILDGNVRKKRLQSVAWHRHRSSSLRTD